MPPNYQQLVPENVTAWLQGEVGIDAARKLSGHRLDALPAGPQHPRLIAAANELIAASKKNVTSHSFNDRVNLVHATSLDRSIRHWYAEYQISLVKVDYRFEEADYVLGTSRPAWR